MRYLIGILIFLFNPVLAVANGNLPTAISQVNADVVFMLHALALVSVTPLILSWKNAHRSATWIAWGGSRLWQIGLELRRSETLCTEGLSGDWRRYKETTELLNSQEWTTFSGLNSFFWNFAEKEVVLQRLDQKLNEILSGVTLMVTHQIVIRPVTGQSTGSGGLVAFNTRAKEEHNLD